MTKKEVKFSLLGDYINILHIHKVCDFCLLETSSVDVKLLNLKTLSNSLRDMYENLFFKLGLMDLSFLILKKEVLGVGCSTDKTARAINATTLEAFSSILKKITKNINYKLKKLKFSEIEVNFLIKNITFC